MRAEGFSNALGGGSNGRCRTGDLLNIRPSARDSTSESGLEDIDSRRRELGVGMVSVSSASCSGVTPSSGVVLRVATGVVGALLVRMRSFERVRVSIGGLNIPV